MNDSGVFLTRVYMHDTEIIGIHQQIVVLLFKRLLYRIDVWQQITLPTIKCFTIKIFQLQKSKLSKTYCHIHINLHKYVIGELLITPIK